jgi:phosphoglycolate phosphatase
LDILHKSGKKLAVVTNKPTRFTLPLLSALSLDGYFQSVVCGDTAALPKPAPDPILLCLQHLGVTASCSLMVGDSITDVDAAKAAQLDVACYRDGYNHGIDVVTLEPTMVFDRMNEILPVPA